MPKPAAVIQTTYCIQFEGRELDVMKGEYDNLVARVNALNLPVVIHGSHQRLCQSLYYGVAKEHDKPKLHAQVMQAVEQCVQDATHEQIVALANLPWRVKEKMADAGLSAPEVVSMLLEFIGRGGGRSEATYFEDFERCVSETLIMGTKRKLSDETQAMLHDAGWGPGMIAGALLAFTEAGGPGSVLGAQQKAEAYLAELVAENAPEIEDDAPEPTHAGPGGLC